MKHYLGIDVGGTNIKFALMDPEGNLLQKGELPTPETSLEAYLDTLAVIRGRFPEAEALVMSAPGKIDADRGYFYTGGALSYIGGTDLPGLLEPRIGIPVCVENDGKCAALAELWQGAMLGVRTGAVMTIGTAIGGAVIIDGKLHRGASFAAGEFSWMATQFDEEYGIPQLWGCRSGVAALTGRYEARKGLAEGSVDGRAFFAALQDGDPDAAETLETYSAFLARGIVSLQAVLEAERIAIGGGVSRQPALIGAIDREVGAVWEHMGAWLPMRRPEIVACRFGNDANLLGALYHYLELNGRPE